MSADVTTTAAAEVPNHVAIIMDGNGRWASGRGRERTHGHQRGSDSVREIVRAARRAGVKALTLYAFSEQNWERPPHEIAALMELLHEFLVSEREELLDNQIRLRAIGRVDKLPPRVRSVLDPLERDTAHLDGMILSLALSYGGQEEIVDAARRLAEEVSRGEREPDSINAVSLAAALPSMDVGPVDLLIRTGGDQRISNFLLYGAAYAELYFCPKLWPDFEVADLHAAIDAFASRERRFGRVLDAPALPLSETG